MLVKQHLFCKMRLSGIPRGCRTKMNLPTTPIRPSARISGAPAVTSLQTNGLPVRACHIQTGRIREQHRHTCSVSDLTLQFFPLVFPATYFVRKRSLQSSLDLRTMNPFLHFFYTSPVHPTLVFVRRHSVLYLSAFWIRSRFAAKKPGNGGTGLIGRPFARTAQAGGVNHRKNLKLITSRGMEIFCL